MPHTNRKKKSGAGDTGDVVMNGAEKTKKIVQPMKRKQVEDGEGWTHVIGGGKKASSGEAWTHAGDFVKDGVAYIERTVEEMRDDLVYYGKQWESSEAAKQLKGVLKGKGAVKNVVCLGLGSLQSARREGRRSSFTQLAALMMILEELGGIGADKIQCVFQDPQYTETDKEFLISLAGIVVDDPLAFDHIKEDTLVYAIHCYGPVYKTISSGPQPAVLIGTDMDNFSRLYLSTSTETLGQHLDDMVKDCEVINFPQLRHDFSDTKIYWRNKPKI
ncbi:hypothetical protein sscle_03g026820 [Sclerotinia sclerotiorum 1980 UF-70]|uniref:SRR1-like domain-containing protein n=2 Tax=Sclerotinia sclerotiorum (strain ATCC 18683 / 1980 / Ss-1) TaxID=665079 RepID=A0A1D9PZC5_SCLS1|nr:hypothetical protein sscle_03g026820 [Sclerotinia sclerotiorum 1980 UF-70]